MIHVLFFYCTGECKVPRRSSTVFSFPWLFGWCLFLLPHWLHPQFSRATCSEVGNSWLYETAGEDTRTHRQSKWFVQWLYTVFIAISTNIQNFGDVVDAPLPVQVALIHALSLADRHDMALESLSRLSEKWVVHTVYQSCPQAHSRLSVLHNFRAENGPRDRMRLAKHMISVVTWYRTLMFMYVHVGQTSLPTWRSNLLLCFLRVVRARVTT